MKSRAERIEDIWRVICSHFYVRPNVLAVQEALDQLRIIAAEVERLEDALRKLVDQWKVFEGYYDNTCWGNQADAYYLLAKNLQREWDEAKQILEPETTNGNDT